MKDREIAQFKDILKRERLRHGWSQQYVAEKVGVNADAVSRWERGISFPKLSVQPDLCQLFAMTTQELGIFSEVAVTSEVDADTTLSDIAGNMHQPQVEPLVNQTNTLTLPSLAITPSISTPLSTPRNPYKGLRAFHQEDAQDFFGRDQLIQEMIGHLRHLVTKAEEQAAMACFLAVIGPSGCGKSSVVQAGLLPYLQAGALTNSEKWIYLAPITPGKHPIAALATALSKYISTSTTEALCEQLNKPAARGLHKLAMQIAAQPATKVALVIDQFEELFTQTENETERQQFIDLLLSACTEPAGVVMVLLTLRADFYDRPMAYQRLGRLIEQQHEAVFPLSVSELLTVIEQPVALADVQVAFEDDLVRDMLIEMQGQHNSLPLLQFALDQLFLRREGHLLTRRAYEEIGGIRGALSKHAERIYADLPSKAHRDLARELFLRLLDFGVTEREVTRRCALLTAFVFVDAEKTQIMYEVIATFINARLLTTDQGEGEIGHIEISHEALISEWPRYVEWQQEFRWDAHLQQSVSRDAALWAQDSKRRDLLYHGTRLTETRGWAQRNTVNRQEWAFLRASVGRSRRVRLFGTLIAMLVVVVSLPLVAGLFGVRTALSNPVLPGGWWVMPITNQHVGDVLLFEAYAYPGVPTAPPIAYIDFTMRWYKAGTAWFTACHLTQHTSNNMFACTVHFHSLGAPPGPILISFDVYDTMGNVRNAPNGVHRIYYSL